MLNKEILLKELKNMPEMALAETLEFVRFIKAKPQMFGTELRFTQVHRMI